MGSHTPRSMAVAGACLALAFAAPAGCGAGVPSDARAPAAASAPRSADERLANGAPGAGAPSGAATDAGRPADSASTRCGADRCAAGQPCCVPVGASDTLGYQCLPANAKCDGPEGSPIDVRADCTSAAACDAGEVCAAALVRVGQGDLELPVFGCRAAREPELGVESVLCQRDEECEAACRSLGEAAGTGVCLGWWGTLHACACEPPGRRVTAATCPTEGRGEVVACARPDGARGLCAGGACATLAECEEHCGRLTAAAARRAPSCADVAAEACDGEARCEAARLERARDCVVEREGPRAACLRDLCNDPREARRLSAEHERVAARWGGGP